MYSKEYFEGMLSYDSSKRVLLNSKGLAVKTHNCGYLNVNGNTMPAQRIAWLLYYGEWPEGQIVHKVYGSRNPCDLNLENYIDDKSKKYKWMFKPW